MDVSIVIPNYNGEQLLQRNLFQVLASVKEYKSGKVEIIIVDDGSTDASASVIPNLKSPLGPSSLREFTPRSSGRGQIPNLKFIKNETNLGFASTVNCGVEKSTGEVVVLLNTDVAPEKDFLQPLVTHFKNSDIFAVGCLDKSIEKGKIVLRGRGMGSFKRGFLLHERGEVDKTDTLWVSGGSGAFRRDVWLKIGGMDPLYNPFYWEDIDLSYRALKSGFKILFEPKSVVIHEHETGSIKKHYRDFQVKIIAYRNQFIFVWKNITDLDKQFFHILWIPYHLIKAILKGDLYFFIGFLLALFKLPAIIKSSFRVQKLFIKSDKEIID